MKVGIMQPYFFPYIGYWQLMNLVDIFVIYDDVTFIKQGYINRNNILCKDKSQLITLELNGASSNKLINEIDIGRNSEKILKTISQNYSKAPYFKTVYSILEGILLQPKVKLDRYIGNSLITIANYLEMSTKFLYSSDINKTSGLKAQDRVLDINEQVGASIYINAIGGKELYKKEFFLVKNIELQFLKTEDFNYKQFEGEFIPYLSIIDLMMFNSKNEIKIILNKYSLQ